MKLRNVHVTEILVRDYFDFLRSHQGDLSSDQADLVKSLRQQNKENGLTDKQTQLLSDLVKSLQPDKYLIIRNY
jgi:hypothetical protein